MTVFYGIYTTSPQKRSNPSLVIFIIIFPVINENEEIQLEGYSPNKIDPYVIINVFSIVTLYYIYYY